MCTRALTLIQPVAGDDPAPERPVREPPAEYTNRDSDLPARDRPAALGPR